mgnify:CR=1 FL=1|tara:strand:+ start:82598 stop:82738 length:141 start_codon:yes stop_codon:yes gene_type:complete
MKRMNNKSHKKQNGHSHALQAHKHFKGDCNAAPRREAKRQIEAEFD